MLPSTLHTLLQKEFHLIKRTDSPKVNTVPYYNYETEKKIVIVYEMEAGLYHHIIFLNSYVCLRKISDLPF